MAHLPSSSWTIMSFALIRSSGVSCLTGSLLFSIFTPCSALYSIAMALLTSASIPSISLGLFSMDSFHLSMSGMFSSAMRAGSPSWFIFTAEASSTTRRSRRDCASVGA